MKTYLRQHQIEDLQREKAALEKALVDPTIQEKGFARSLLNRVSGTLEYESPPELKGDELDAAVREEKELREEMSHGMPTAEEMRKCPPGAIGLHRAHSGKFKEKMLRWKNLRLMLNRGSPDPDIANFERYRPKTSQLNMDGAVIPGQQFFLPSQQYKENYDEAFGNPHGDELAKLRSEVADLRELVAHELSNAAEPMTAPVQAAPTARSSAQKKSWTPERREAAAAASRERWRKKREETAAQSPKE